MEAPPNDDQPAAPPVDVSGERVYMSRPRSFRVRIVPTQIEGRFALREVVERNAAGTSTPTEVGLESVLVHFLDMNGEWLHSQLFKEDHAMQDVEAVLYYTLRRKMEKGMCYRLVWHPKRRGPYPFRSGGGSEPYFQEYSDLNSAEGVRRTDDRQIMITCVKAKLNAPRERKRRFHLFESHHCSVHVDKTYNIMHRPVAHLSIDGCEALSAANLPAFESVPPDTIPRHHARAVCQTCNFSKNFRSNLDVSRINLNTL